MEQPQYNMLHRDKFEVEFGQLYQNFGMGTTIWSPLASGVLSGKYNAPTAPTETRMDIDGLEWLKDKTITAENLTRVEKLAPIAKQLGISLPVLAIAWCLKNPNVSTVMLGASKVSQLEENLTAVAKKHLLTTQVMQEIELALNNTPIRPNF